MTTNKNTAASCRCTSKTPAKKSPCATGKKRVTFTYTGAPGAKVFLAGCFNEWAADSKEMKDRKNNGVYTCQCLLAPGTYQYKFVIDGIWTLDNSNANFVNNDLGSLNSVIEIG